MRRVSLTLCALVAAAVLAACGSAASRPESRALALWSRFPANSSPRPVVVQPEYGAVLAPDAGFPSGDAKLAFISAQFELAAALPRSPARRDGYPIIAAAQAIKRLRESGQPASAAGGAQLRITRVSLGTARFLTDRGWRRLPAWRVRLAGVSTPAAVLAVAPSGIFNQPRLVEPTHHAFDSYPESAVDSANGRTPTIGFVGAHSGNQPCDASYTAMVVQSAHAVAVQLHQHLTPVPANTACDAVGYPRNVKVRLSHPLGARVLVDAVNGGVVPVYPTGTRLRPGTP